MFLARMLSTVVICATVVMVTSMVLEAKKADEQDDDSLDYDEVNKLKDHFDDYRKKVDALVMKAGFKL